MQHSCAQLLSLCTHITLRMFKSLTSQNCKTALLTAFITASPSFAKAAINKCYIIFHRRSAKRDTLLISLPLALCSFRRDKLHTAHCTQGDFTVQRTWSSLSTPSITVTGQRLDWPRFRWCTRFTWNAGCTQYGGFSNRRVLFKRLVAIERVYARVLHK